MVANSIDQSKEFPKIFFSRRELQSFQSCNQVRLFFDVSLIWGQAFFGLFLICNFSNIWLTILGIIVVGSSQHGLSLVAHEGAHTLLSKSRRMNDFLARWFFAAPVLLPFSTYRKRHFEHHLHACTVRDTKDLYRQKITGIFLAIEFFKAISGFDFFKQVFLVLNHSVKDHSGNNYSKRTANPIFFYDIFSIVLSQFAIVVFFVAFYSWTYYLLAWILPLFTINMLCGKLRSIVERQPLSSDSPNQINSKYFKGTSAPFCRSISPTIFEKFLLTKINFCYHAEHHLYPSVSYQFLPNIRDRISVEDKKFLSENGYSHKKSYFRVIAALFIDYE